jgi:hypothetical protein
MIETTAMGTSTPATGDNARRLAGPLPVNAILALPDLGLALSIQFRPQIRFGPLSCGHVGNALALSKKYGIETTDARLGSSSD